MFLGRLMIRPPVGSIMPWIMSNMVLFPHPLAPMIPTFSELPADQETLSSTSFVEERPLSPAPFTSGVQETRSKIISGGSPSCHAGTSCTSATLSGLLAPLFSGTPTGRAGGLRWLRTLDSAFKGFSTPDFLRRQWPSLRRFFFPASAARTMAAAAAAAAPAAAQALPIFGGAVPAAKRERMAAVAVEPLNLLSTPCPRSDSAIAAG
mmetsp:Transcript_68912/g.152486  ORF Transcript_68912/g.152486 Transcript_68912/m.152486 type:complete len:207 (+) Transcript_68912:483-1103(+)